MKSLIAKSIITAGVLISAVQPASATSDYCREYISRVRVGDAPAPAYGTACYQPDGSWKIGREEQEVAYYEPRPVVNHIGYVTTREYVQPPIFSLSFGSYGYHQPHRSYYHDRHWKHRRGHHDGHHGWGRGRDDHRGVVGAYVSRGRY